jgi:hypothetical protein
VTLRRPSLDDVFLTFTSTDVRKTAVVPQKEIA